MASNTDAWHSPQKKDDNKHLGAKLILRRHFLDKYHREGTPFVFDACQGEGLIWRRLRAEYSVRYFGVDRKPKRGRLTIDSTRLLETGPLVYDVVDIDTYGSPWKHWTNLLPHVRKPTTVFLTVGAGRLGGGIDSAALDAMGLDRLARWVPVTLRGKLAADSSAYCLGLALRFGLDVAEAREISGLPGQARYYGLHLLPRPRE